MTRGSINFCMYPGEEHNSVLKPRLNDVIIHRRDYVAHEVLPQKLKEPEKHVKSDESMDLTSVYKQDYNSYPICQVPPCLPCETREISTAKMNTKSTYKGMYFCNFFQDFTSSFIFEEGRLKNSVQFCAGAPTDWMCCRLTKISRRDTRWGCQPHVSDNIGYL